MADEVIERVARAWASMDGREVSETYIADATELLKRAALRPGDTLGEYVVVPLEPTEAMTYAARYALRNREGNIAAPIYRAMLTALTKDSTDA